MEMRNFSKVGDLLNIPDLGEIQTKSYYDFLQRDVPEKKRKKIGLQALLREVFPMKNYDGTMSLQYVSYEFGKPRYSPDECRKLRLTYGMPFRIRLRLNKAELVEEDVYMGDMPIMIGGGEFIINGAERVIVTQLHRSPGVDFLEESRTTERRLHSCRIIPERGSWIEINISKRDVLSVRIDQSGRLLATCLLRAMSEEYSTNGNIIKLFYDTERVKLDSPKKYSSLRGRFVTNDLVDKKTGEVLLEGGREISETIIKYLRDSSLRQINVIKEVKDPLILNTLMEDTTKCHEEALLRIYTRLRPGNPPNLEKAKELFHEKFFDERRYSLGKVGRFRLNRKFEQNIEENVMTLRKEDFLNSLRYLLKLRAGEGQIDDIDHLGNRRLRTFDELATDELRKGFLKLRRTVQERMSLKDSDQLTPRVLVNSKTVSSAIEFFFGRSELSQVVDQTNPLAQLAHERRLSALGPGGLNRKRAGFEVRDVHISHYGRICPIETPEGTNIGLIAYLSIYAAVDAYGFLITPYRKISKGKATDKTEFLRADEEDKTQLAPADLKLDKNGKVTGEAVLARQDRDFRLVDSNELKYMDISPKQLVGVSASLIPFLEHNDANRALMGSNMQRQAVPLLITEPPLVATGMEKPVASNSGMVVKALKNGTVRRVTAERIVVDDEIYTLRKFVGLNERTCLNQTPIVKEGDTVKQGDVIADGAATSEGELSLGRNVLVAFMPYDGYNFEDAIVVSERLVKDDRYTSLHIEEFEVEIRETKLGREEFTRDIPNMPEKALSNLDDEGIVTTGTRVIPGDILVGKVAPKSKSELSPEEKLLHAIFGKAGEDVKNDSLEIPSGVEGYVIGAEKFSSKAYLSEDERQEINERIKTVERNANRSITKLFKDLLADMEKALGTKLADKSTGKRITVRPGASQKEVLELEQAFDVMNLRCPAAKNSQIMDIYQDYYDKIEAARDKMEEDVSHLRRGDELPTGVLEMVKVYVCTKRTLSVGDKVAGRHGNKGVIAKIVPEEDMPFMEDGTPVEILLNPLGVPSRMNVGQILETHLGWAARMLGFQAITPVFDGASEEEIRKCLSEAGLPEDGKCVLYDGRTGEPFEQRITVGYTYIMKLHHLVDDKVHARATGPYSLITQQPLGGKARFGGQRFGEMEVWAVEAYGASYVLQELLTVKSDDVEGRTKIYESMVKGENTLEAGTPVSFEVLTNEIKGLGLSLELEKRKI